LYMALCVAFDPPLTRKCPGGAGGGGGKIFRPPATQAKAFVLLVAYSESYLGYSVLK